MSKLNRTSRRLTQSRTQGASQAMLLATELTEADLDKAQVGIASVWWEGNPCNMHLLELAGHVKEGVIDAGLVGLRFNTIGVSDGISMGTDGMSYSLPSRDLIADSIETVMGAQFYDAAVALPGCDKNLPRLRHGTRPDQPTQPCGLRRHDSAGMPPRPTGRHRLRLSELRPGARRNHR